MVMVSRHRNANPKTAFLFYLLSELRQLIHKKSKHNIFPVMLSALPSLSQILYIIHQTKLLVLLVSGWLLSHIIKYKLGHVPKFTEAGKV